jgi:hypothetical protein
MSRNDLNVPCDFVQAVEDETVPPHHDRNRIVAEAQAVCTDEQSLGLREEPNAQHHQKVDKVTQIRQEVMIADLVVLVPSYWHEVGQLHGIPDVEEFRPRADEPAGDEDVQYSRDKADLFTQSDCLRIVEPLAEFVDGRTHALAVFVQLLLRPDRYALPPFLHDVFLTRLRPTGDLASLKTHLLGLLAQGILHLLKSLWQCEVLEDVEHGEAIQGWEIIIAIGVKVARVGVVTGGGCQARRAGRVVAMCGVGSSVQIIVGILREGARGLFEGVPLRVCHILLAVHSLRQVKFLLRDPVKI